jgi:hypothetical protein
MSVFPMRARFRICVGTLFYAILAGSPLHSLAASATERGFQHRRFQLEQQQDALSFQLQQSLRGRTSDLAPADARRLDALQLQQRLEYQQLEQQQAQRELSLRLRAPDDTRQLEAQRERFAQERQLELQRFELDRQRLLQSLPRQPLQPPADAGRLK